MKTAKSPQRWEVSDFLLTQLATLPTGQSSEQLLMLHIASITQSMAQDSSTVLGTTLSGMTRKLMIGGIVFDFGTEVAGQMPNVADTPILAGDVFVNAELCLDQIVTPSASTFFPNAIQGYSPFTSDFPTQIITATTPNPQSREAFRPLRSLWSKRYMKRIAGRAAVPAESLLTIPNEQLLAGRYGTVNRRLRLILDDHQGLYFCFATFNASGFDVPTSNHRQLRHWVTGRLYWRYVF